MGAVRDRVRDDILAYHLSQSRALALEVGSAISLSPGVASKVLVNTQPILEFLLGGDLTSADDLYARRRAVRRHLDNIRGEGARTDNPLAFLRQARVYYEFLVPPPASPEAAEG